MSVLPTIWVPTLVRGGNDFYNYLCLEIPSCKEVNMPPTESRSRLPSSVISELFFSQSLKLLLVSQGRHGTGLGSARGLGPRRLRSECPPGLTRATVGWGWGGRAQACLGAQDPRPGHGPGPRNPLSPGLHVQGQALRPRLSLAAPPRPPAGQSPLAPTTCPGPPPRRSDLPLPRLEPQPPLSSPRVPPSRQRGEAGRTLEGAE